MATDTSTTNASGSIIISGIMALLSTIGNFFTNLFTSKRQQEHDVQMAEINRKNAEQLMIEQNSIQQNTNTWANQKGHMVSAGYSPALLYGDSMQPAQVSGGSGSGNASSLPQMQLFDRVPLDSVAQTMLNQRQQTINAERVKAQNERDRAESQLAMMRTAHEYYNANVAKKLQNTIVEQAVADLHNTKADTEYKRFMTEHGLKMEPYQLAQAGLVNQETAAKIEEIKSQVMLNAVSGQHMRADINRMAHLNELSDAEKGNVVESMKRSQVGRIMQQFGLDRRLTPASLRNTSILHKVLNDEQMKGAYLALRELGFNETEATSTVLYYTASDPKDVTPTVINAGSRFFAELLKLAK